MRRFLMRVLLAAGCGSGNGGSAATPETAAEVHPTEIIADQSPMPGAADWLGKEG
jgi:hypothetical protein